MAKQFRPRRCYRAGHETEIEPIATAQGQGSLTMGTWRAILARIRNKRSRYYKMDIDPRWLCYANFLADMGPRPPGMSIDRIDNEKGYWPWNCRWATPAQQNANQGPKRKYTPYSLVERYGLAETSA